MGQVRIGIVGAGFMGRTHAEVISRYCHDAHFVAIAGGTRAPALAAEYHVDCEENVESLVKRNDIDAVIITTPHDCHIEHGLAAADHGKHILMEKPLGTTLEGIDLLLDTCTQANVNLMTAQTQRYRDGNRVAKSLIDAGVIGRIRMIEEVQHALLPADSSQSSETCGRLLGHGIHSPDRLRWFLDDEAEWVCGFSDNYAVDSEHENSSMTLIQFSRGAMASIWVTFESAPPLFPSSTFHARIIGEKGLLDVDSYGLVKLGTQDGWQVMFEQEPFDFQKDPLSLVRLKSFSQQDQEFVDSIVECRAPAITGEDGRAAVKIVLAAYQSQLTRQMVRL